MLRPSVRFVLPVPLAVLALWAPLAAAQEPPVTRVIQLVLLEGSREPVAETGPIPDNVRPALEDAAQILPFRSYRLLDVAVVSSDRVAEATMHGPAGTTVAVRAGFRPPAGSTGGGARLQVHDFEVVRVDRSAGSTADEPGDRETKPAYSVRTEELIRTSFSATVGRTVVVGTSRLNGGDRALIVLFTALE